MVTITGKVVIFMFLLVLGIFLLFLIGNLPTYFGEMERRIFSLLTIFMIIGGIAWVVFT